MNSVGWIGEPDAAPFRAASAPRSWHGLGSLLLEQEGRGPAFAGTAREGWSVPLRSRTRIKPGSGDREQAGYHRRNIVRFGLPHDFDR
jgi:hypothetical protein